MKIVVLLMKGQILSQYYYFYNSHSLAIFSKSSSDYRSDHLGSIKGGETITLT